MIEVILWLVSFLVCTTAALQNRKKEWAFLGILSFIAFVLELIML